MDDNLNMELVFDFSQDTCDNLDGNLGELIRAAINQKNVKKDIKPIDPKDKERLETIRENILYIAKKNHAKVTIRSEYSTRISIELEFDVIDFDDYKLKDLFADTVKLSDSVTMESRMNGKFVIILEINLEREIKENNAED